MCYALSTENDSGGPQYLPDGFSFSEDNNPPGHRTLHPQESRTCDCVSLSIGAKNYAYCEAITDLNGRGHCICLLAAAEPPALDLSDDKDGWKVACIIFLMKLISMEMTSITFLIYLRRWRSATSDWMP